MFYEKVSGGLYGGRLFIDTVFALFDIERETLVLIFHLQMRI